MSENWNIPPLTTKEREKSREKHFIADPQILLLQNSSIDEHFQRKALNCHVRHRTACRDRDIDICFRMNEPIVVDVLKKTYPSTFQVDSYGRLRLTIGEWLENVFSSHKVVKELLWIGLRWKSNEKTCTDRIQMPIWCDLSEFVDETYTVQNYVRHPHRLNITTAARRFA